MTTSLQSEHLECLKSFMLPCLPVWGAIRRSMERKSLLCHFWLQFPNLIEIPEEGVQTNMISDVFSSSRCIFFLVPIASSCGSWRSSKWPPGSLEFPELQQRCYSTDEEEKEEMKTETKQAQVLVPGPLQASAYLFTPKSQDSRWNHFYFFKIISGLCWDVSGYYLKVSLYRAKTHIHEK